ncbi:MAG: hypothetical protein LBQ62_07885 [Candidatus Accumulibacter sp.]|nr:hypothetical protein [Accumulibacter sp.]
MTGAARRDMTVFDHLSSGQPERGRWAFAEFFDVYEMQDDFARRMRMRIAWATLNSDTSRSSPSPTPDASR